MSPGLNPGRRRPVVFLPGEGLPARAWDRWVDLFTARGYAAIAPERIAGIPGAPPVLVGYGSGGLLALTLSGLADAAGVIAIDAPAVPVPPGAPAGADGEPVLLVVGGQGPSLITGAGWRPVAESCLSWLDAHEL